MCKYDECGKCENADEAKSKNQKVKIKKIRYYKSEIIHQNIINPWYLRHRKSYMTKVY